MNSIDPTDDPASTEPYVIRVTGELGGHWQAWFEGMTFEKPGDGTTVITGRITDQAALHGVLQRIRDLGVPLISVGRLDPEDPTTPNQPDKEGTQP